MATAAKLVSRVASLLNVNTDKALKRYQVLMLKTEATDADAAELRDVIKILGIGIPEMQLDEQSIANAEQMLEVIAAAEGSEEEEDALRRRADTLIVKKKTVLEDIDRELVEIQNQQAEVRSRRGSAIEAARRAPDLVHARLRPAIRFPDVDEVERLCACVKSAASRVGFTVTHDETPGALVAEVKPESRAGESGLKAGDRIVSIEGATFADPREFRAKLSDVFRQAFTIEVLRSGKEKAISIRAPKPKSSIMSQTAANVGDGPAVQ